ncbi:hypothetical protein [Effusibacillus consociatus]|uniref:Uncharacterized protein n=1 Tax=Effusibacillus consociatus TaxID=1117041 RepID=A0ABV9Q5A0_9BACL
MLKKALLLCMFLVAIPGTPTVEASQLPDIELFDVTKGKVVQHIVNTEEIQQEAVDWLRAVTEPAPQLNIEFHDGILLRVPLEPIIKIGEVSISQLFLVLSPSREALLIVLTEENRPLVLRFNPGRLPLFTTLKEFCGIPLLYDIN